VPPSFYRMSPKGPQPAFIGRSASGARADGTRRESLPLQTQSRREPLKGLLTEDPAVVASGVL